MSFRFNIGDVVWVMKENKPSQIEVKTITVKEDKDGSSFRYNEHYYVSKEKINPLANICDVKESDKIHSDMFGYKYVVKSHFFSDSDVFGSKEELLKSL